MEKKRFKNHEITRNIPKKDYCNPGPYKPYLEKDFCNRCAYCNLLDKLITTPFEIDHFIPEEAFKGKNDDLFADYENLIYACKKCNGAKSSQFEGNIFSSEKANDLFYDPVKIDYNSVFYRNEIGIINSDDPKGRDMISRLKLYRPIHPMGWVCDQTKQLIDKIEKEKEKESNTKRKDFLQQALDELYAFYYKIYASFIASYNDKKLTAKSATTYCNNVIKMTNGIESDI